MRVQRGELWRKRKGGKCGEGEKGAGWRKREVDRGGDNEKNERWGGERQINFARIPAVRVYHVHIG